jgi:hypothetical protein
MNPPWVGYSIPKSLTTKDAKENLATKDGEDARRTDRTLVKGKEGT